MASDREWDMLSDIDADADTPAMEEDFLDLPAAGEATDSLELEAGEECDLLKEPDGLGGASDNQVLPELSAPREDFSEADTASEPLVFENCKGRDLEILTRILERVSPDNLSDPEELQLFSKVLNSDIWQLAWSNENTEYIEVTFSENITVKSDHQRKPRMKFPSTISGKKTKDDLLWKPKRGYSVSEEELIRASLEVVPEMDGERDRRLDRQGRLTAKILGETDPVKINRLPINRERETRLQVPFMVETEEDKNELTRELKLQRRFSICSYKSESMRHVVEQLESELRQLNVRGGSPASQEDESDSSDDETDDADEPECPLELLVLSQEEFVHGATENDDLAKLFAENPNFSTKIAPFDLTKDEPLSIDTCPKRVHFIGHNKDNCLDEYVKKTLRRWDGNVEVVFLNFCAGSELALELLRSPYNVQAVLFASNELHNEFATRFSREWYSDLLCNRSEGDEPACDRFFSATVERYHKVAQSVATQFQEVRDEEDVIGLVYRTPEDYEGLWWKAFPSERLIEPYMEKMSAQKRAKALQKREEEYNAARHDDEHLFFVRRKPLREEQCKILAEVSGLIANERKNSCIALPTGFGKTVLAAALVERLLPLWQPISHTPVLFIVQERVLVYQQASALESFLGLQVHRCCGGGGKAETWGKMNRYAGVIVITAGCMNNILNEEPTCLHHIKLAIFDECHHVRKDHSMHDLARRLKENSIPILGLTATPVADSKSVKDDIIQLLDNLGDAKLVSCKKKAGRVLPQVIRVDVPSALEEVDQFEDMKEFLETEEKKGLALGIKETNDGGFVETQGVREIKSLLQKQLAKRETQNILIFVERRETSKILKSYLESAPELELRGKISYLNGENSEKELHEIVKKFESGEIKVLVATSIVQEGLDIQKCDTVILARPVTSAVQLLQSMGRARAKEKAIYLVCNGIGWERYEKSRKEAEGLEIAIDWLSKNGVWKDRVTLL